jgi:thiol-disulfide isomerase/thioredoxin
MTGEVQMLSRLAAASLLAGSLYFTGQAAVKDLVVSQDGAALTVKCGDSAAPVAELPEGQMVTLRFSLAGADNRCYSVSTIVDGRAVRGFVAKDAVTGADDFEAARREAAAGSFVEAIWGEGPPSGKKIPTKQTSAKRGAALLGNPAANFSLPDLSGQSHSLASMRGKVVLLDFWASWCGPCRRSMPHIEALHREYGPRGLVVLGVNSETAAKAKDYLQANGFTFPTLVDNGGNVGQQFQVSGIPTTVLIDRSGRVSAYLVGAGSEGRLRAAVMKAGL